MGIQNDILVDQNNQQDNWPKKKDQILFGHICARQVDQALA
jgi:hypothetical protein